VTECKQCLHLSSRVLKAQNLYHGLHTNSHERPSCRMTESCPFFTNLYQNWTTARLASYPQEVSVTTPIFFTWPYKKLVSKLWLHLDLSVVWLHNTCRGWGSSVGIVTCYGLYGPGMESRCGRDFPHLSRSALGLTQLPVQRVTGIFPGRKAAGVWRWQSTRI
jgi:hypothetical protein